MSEFQPDDPDPLPSSYEYSANYQTDLPYDDMELTAELAEREAIYHLTEAANQILNVYGQTGNKGARHAYVEGAELHHRMTERGIHLFAFNDSIGEHQRCRAWDAAGSGVSWCDDEQRYEPAQEVRERLMLLFPIAKTSEISVPKSREGAIENCLKLKRTLARVILR